MFDGVDKIFREGVEVDQDSGIHARGIYHTIVYKVSVGVGRIRVCLQDSFFYLCYLGELQIKQVRPLLLPALKVCQMPPYNSAS